MLSYQHGYHAGGPADIHKLLALAAMLVLLSRKARPITYMESHAGRGVYDLTGEQATKTGEWEAGFGQMERSAHPFWTALDAIRAQHGATAYPGSPAIARALLRPQDRLCLMELHPAEHDALKSTLAGEGVEIHRRDGFEGLLALSPPKPRRGLVLVDPSYERKEEYAETAAFARALLRKWPEAVVMIWYPLLPAARHQALLEGIASLAPLRNEIAFPPHRDRSTGMHGSALAILNAPFGAENCFK